MLASDDIRNLLDEGPLVVAFVDVGGALTLEWIAARRVIISSRSKLAKLPFASPSILESHGLDQEAADALGRGDIATFTKRRAAILDRWFERFFTERIGTDDSDRPPIAELIRRADKALAAP